MSRFTVKRSYKQLLAERNALEYFIEQRKNARCECKLSDEQKAQLQSDEALLAEIEKDINTVREVIDDELPTRLEGSE